MFAFLPELHVRGSVRYGPVPCGRARLLTKKGGSQPASQILHAVNMELAFRQDKHREREPVKVEGVAFVIISIIIIIIIARAPALEAKKHQDVGKAPVTLASVRQRMRTTNLSAEDQEVSTR